MYTTVEANEDHDVRTEAEEAVRLDCVAAVRIINTDLQYVTWCTDDVTAIATLIREQRESIEDRKVR